MVSLSTWFRYAAHKFEYSISLSWKKYNIGQINSTQLTDAVWKNFFQGKLTYTHWNKGEQAMAPIVSTTGGSLLEARDSRVFGPVPMTDILGRVVYSLRTAVDHGPVENSRMAMNQDSSVLAVELDVEEMAKNNKV
uniref:Uncharacterized protein n=1 Tax=Leersia perrieri TaxID=77586 RepID=A0A0D9W1Q6_9ORYZ